MRASAAAIVVAAGAGMSCQPAPQPSSPPARFDAPAPISPSGPRLAAAVGSPAQLREAAAADRPPQKAVHAEVVYEGRLGEQRIVVRLRCDGAAPCSGYYFYQHIGEMLKLAADGGLPNAYRESNLRGAATGRFALDRGAGAAALSGTWTSADGKRKLPVALALIDASSPPRAFLRKMRESAPDDPRCREEVQGFEIAGLDDPAIEQAVNDFFDLERRGVLIDPRAFPNEIDFCHEGSNRCVQGAGGRTIRCSDLRSPSGYEATVKLEVAYLDEHLLSVVFTQHGDTGGAHPFFTKAGMNVDLRSGALVCPDDWFAPGASIDPASMVDPKLYPDGVPYFSTGLLTTVAKPNVRDDLAALGRRPLFDGFTSSYVTPSALMMIPDVPEVSRHLRGTDAPIPWSAIGAKLRPDSPVARLARP